MVRMELRQQRRRSGAPMPACSAVSMASFRAADSHSELTSPEGHRLAKRKGASPFAPSGDAVTSSSQRFRPSDSRIGLE